MKIPQYEDLKGKIILVTGATSGIGLEVCKELALQGAHVAFNYRSESSNPEKIKQELEALGGKATPVKFDVSSNDEIVKAINEFVEANGPITGLVNNAGMSKDQIVLRLKEEDLSKTLDVNLKGAILVTAACSRHFLKAENVSVVNVSSVVGLMGNPSQIAYAASKAGMIGFTKSYAKELASRNIRCNAICPGFIETRMTEGLAGEKIDSYLGSIPLKRFGKSEEVAGLICFLLSAASSYITGEAIKIDGGLYI